MHLYDWPALFRCDFLFEDRGNTVPRCPMADKSSVLRSRCYSLIGVVQQEAMTPTRRCTALFQTHRICPADSRFAPYPQSFFFSRCFLAPLQPPRKSLPVL